MCAWSFGAVGVLVSSYRVRGRGEECGFLDLLDRPLLVACLGPARAAAGAEDERIQTKHDGDGGRSAPRTAWQWHENLPGDLLGLGGCLTDERRVLRRTLLAPGRRPGPRRRAMWPSPTWTALGLAVWPRPPLPPWPGTRQAPGWCSSAARGTRPWCSCRPRSPPGSAGCAAATPRGGPSSRRRRRPAGRRPATRPRRR